jgi:hypothetical protein
MVNPEHLRILAERMLAMSRKAIDPRLAEWFSIKAGEYHDQALTLEAAAAPVVACPRSIAQQAQQPQPDGHQKKE